MPRSAAYSSVGLSLATTYLGAVLLALLSFVPAVRHISDNPPLWVFALLPAGLLVLHPKVLSRIIAVGERVLGEPSTSGCRRGGTPWSLVVMHVPAWFLIGTATWCVVRAFTPSPPFWAVIFATMVSWVVGFIAIGVPGGLGVREATFAAVLSVALPAGVGAAAALAARLIFMLVDTLGAMVVGGLARRRPPVGDIT